MIPSSFTLYFKESTNEATAHKTSEKNSTAEEKQRFEELLGKNKKSSLKSSKSLREEAEEAAMERAHLHHALPTTYKLESSHLPKTSNITLPPVVPPHHLLPHSFAAALNKIATPSLEALQLRVAQGPWSGLIVQATMKNGTLQLRLSGKQASFLKKIEEQNKALSSLFGSALDQPFTLELHHADQ